MPGAAAGFEIRLGVSIPMSDGVSLNADLLLPTGAEPQPCLLTMTPYTTHFAYASAAAFARQGFAVCIVDVRGRGGSGGSFDLNHDGPDGAACVNWIAVQPWCDGNVAMFGGSYSGMNQWSVAAERPAALRAIAPLVAPLVGLDGGDAYRGIVYPYTARWAALVQGKTLHMGLLQDEDYWRGLFFRHWKEGHGVEKLAWLTGALDPIMETNLKGLQDAAWVARCSPTPTQYAAIDIPVLSGTGTAENAQRGALEYRRRHLEARPDAQHWLMIGPTTHAGTRDPAPSGGAAQTTARDEVATKEDETVLGFYNWALRGTPLPEFLDSPAKIYLAEAEVWCALPEVYRHAALFLSNGGLQTIPPKSFGVTRLQGPPPPQPPAEVASLFVVLSGENGLESWHLTDHSGVQVDFRAGGSPDRIQIDRRRMLLHRLFENRLQITSPAIENILATHVSEFIRLMNVPASEQERKQRDFLDSWPFAPHLLQLLEDQVLVATDAQETRDLIRILARCSVPASGGSGRG